MRSRSLSTPSLPRPVLTQRRHSDPPKATPRHSTLSNRLLDDPRKARLVIVSPAESQLDTEDEEQLSAWEAGLQEQELRVIHLAMDDEAGAIDLLCDMLDPVVDERTQIVVLHDPAIRTKSESRAISGEIGHRLRQSGSHCPAPIVIDSGHLAADELEPRLKALVCVEHEPTGASNAHEVPSAQGIAMGDLLDPLPPALLIVKVGSFTTGEQALLMQLSDSLGSAPLLCLSVNDPAGDLAQIKPLLLARLTPMTPTLVLGSSRNDRMAFMLCHELSMLAGELRDAALAFKPGAVGQAEVASIDDSTPVDAFQRLSDTAQERWKESVAWQDAQYIDQLAAWTKQPGHCNSQYPHAGMAIVRYLTRLLAVTQKAPHEPIKAIISVQGLLCLPPLPPHRRFEAITLTGCTFSDLRSLPGGMRSLRVRLGDPHDIDLDAAVLSCCEQIHLEDNKLTSVLVGIHAVETLQQGDERGRLLHVLKALPGGQLASVHAQRDPSIQRMGHRIAGQLFALVFIEVSVDTVRIRIADVSRRQQRHGTLGLGVEMAIERECIALPREHGRRFQQRAIALDVLLARIEPRALRHVGRFVIGHLIA